jgi:hypothetical protein
LAIKKEELITKKNIMNKKFLTKDNINIKPVVVYNDALKDKVKILADNIGKSGVYQ